MKLLSIYISYLFYLTWYYMYRYIFIFYIGHITTILMDILNDSF